MDGPSSLLEETMREAKVFERQFEVLIDPSDDFCFSFEMEPGIGHKLKYEFSVSMCSIRNRCP